MSEDKTPDVIYVIISWTKKDGPVIREYTSETAEAVIKSLYFHERVNPKVRAVGIYKLMPEEQPLEAKRVTE